MMDKDHLRIKAVKNNDVEALARLSDGTEWYKYTQPQTGDTLLHIAVLAEKKEIFDYLLAIVDVPLNHKNKQGETVLNICCPWNCRRGRFDDHFACELIKRGISVDCLFLPKCETLLHLAVRKRLVKTLKLLINMGYDINAVNTYAESPIWYCVERLTYTKTLPAEPKVIEMLTALLYHNVDLTNVNKDYNAFEFVVIWYCGNDLCKELLFYYVIDEYTSIHFEIVLILGYERSALFRDSVEHTKNVIVNADTLSLTSTIIHLFEMDSDYLHLLIKKCPNAIREAFASVSHINETQEFCKKNFMENADMLLASDLRDDTIEFLCRCQRNVFSLAARDDESVLTLSCVCFLLSYGLQASEDRLAIFYVTYGYCELIKILLRTEMEKAYSYTWPPLLMLLYDLNCDFQYVLEKSEESRLEYVSDLLPYFAHAKLRALCASSENAEVVAMIQNQPDVPLLSELARNVVREYLIKTFNIRKASQFYTLVNTLPIASEHKKIITLEKNLY